MPDFAATITAQTGSAETIGRLREVRDGLHESMEKRLPDYSVQEQVDLTNHMHECMIKRTIALSEAVLAERGMGPPPVSYEFVLFGSGGRREQTLWSDQDNGLIYNNAQGVRRHHVDNYFEQLASRIVENLDVLGYPPCEGGVFAVNAQWRRPLHRWLSQMEEWFAEPTWESVRYLLILADMRSVYGEGGFTAALRKAFAQHVKENPSILSNMMTNTLRHKVLLGIFGHLIKEQYGEDAGGLDIKYGAYIPLVNGIRLLAIRQGIPETSTLARIRQLNVQQAVSTETAEQWERAFRLCLQLRAASHAKLENGHYVTTGVLQPGSISKDIRDELKAALKIGRELQKYIKKTVPQA